MTVDRAPQPPDQWRVEELARRAELSVDTIRFYQKRRLLQPPERTGRVAWYGPEHLERLARVLELRSRGLTLALIGRILDGDLDATDAPLAAAVARADAEAPEEFLTLAELADRSGVPLVLLEAVARENLLVARVLDGEARYTIADIAVVQQGLRLLEQGLPLPDLLALAHEHHETTREIAETAVGLFDRYVRVPLRASDLPDDEKAERLVAAFRALLPAVTTLVTHHFRRVLLEVAQEHLESVGEETELAAVNVAAGEPARELDLVSRAQIGVLPSADDKPRAVEAMFDRIAPRYDLLNRMLTFRMDVGWRRIAVQALELSAPARVLDLACGTGDLCRTLTDAGHRAIGVDFSSGMLRAARTDAPLVRADALRLPFADASFDGITCGFALRNFSALAPVLHECGRVLRPGGHVALLDVAEPASPVVRFAHGAWFRHVVPFVGGIVSDRAAYRYLPASTAYLPPAPELLGLVVDAGIVDVSRRTLGLGAAQLITGTRAG